MKKLIVISSYPKRFSTHGKETVGVASYTKNLLTHLKKENKKLQIQVYAEIFDKKEKYIENGILIKRFWQRNNLKSILLLFKEILNRKEKDILISLEAFMFGSLYYNFFLILFLIIAKIKRKNIFILLHQVVESLKYFYLPLIFLSKKIFVFELHFKKILFNHKKIIFIPHAIEDYKINNKEIKVNNSCLFFGFLSPYKGIDFLINIWQKKFGNLIIAGDINPNHIKNKKNLNYLKKLKEKAYQKKITITGFIPENKIKYYFQSAELVIFPYKIFFSSSGPLSFCFSFEKPFILSRPLEDYFESPDFQEALKETGLKKEDFLFDFTPESFEKRLSWARKNLDKLSAFSKLMKQKRSWGKVANIYLEILK